MRSLVLGAASLVLIALPAVAQPPPGPFPADAIAQRIEQGRYWVFFDFDSSNLRPDARQVVEDAAASYKRTGAARIDLVGSADRTGPTAYNQQLSERRAEAVRRELERLGVPSSVVSIRAEGYEAPIVPNPPGVREPLNRYVAIVFPEREAAPPPPPAMPAPVAQAAPPPPAPKWAFSVGPWIGYNLKETDRGNNQKSSVLVGPEIRVDYSFTPNWAMFVDLVGFNTLDTSSSDGFGGRAALGLTHQWNLGNWHPSIGPKVGYIGGKGVEDGVIAGPELGLTVDVAAKAFIYARVAYDHDFRNDLDQGIINGGLGVGFRF